MRIPVLAVDPGVANFGIAAIDWTPRGPRVIAMGYMETEMRRKEIAEDARERIDLIMPMLDQWYERHRPTRIVAEAFTFQQRGIDWKAMQTLRLLGRLEEWAVQHGCTYEEIPTGSVKSRIGAGKKATKEDVQRCVVRLTGCKLPPTKKKRSHIGDAIAVGVAAGGTRR